MVFGEKRNKSSSSNFLSNQPSKKTPKVTPVSCLECRRRKIKCDRARICKSCDKKGLDCVYPDTFRSIKISSSKLNNVSKVSKISKNRNLPSLSSSSSSPASRPILSTTLTEDETNSSEEGFYSDQDTNSNKTSNLDNTTLQNELIKLRKENESLLAQLKSTQLFSKVCSMKDSKFPVDRNDISYAFNHQITKEILIDEYTLRSYIKEPVALPPLSQYDHVNIQFYTKIIHCLFKDVELAHYGLDKPTLVRKLDHIKNDFESMEFVMLICVISIIVIRMREDLASDIEKESGFDSVDLIRTYERQFNSYKAMSHYSKGLFKLQALVLYLESHSEDQSLFNGLALEIFVNFKDSPAYNLITGRARGYFYIRCLINDFPIPQGYNSQCQCSHNGKEKNSNNTETETETETGTGGFLYSIERLVQTDMRLCEVINTTLRLRLNFQLSKVFTQKLSKSIETADNVLKDLYEQRRNNLEGFSNMNYLIHEKIQYAIILYYCDFKLHNFLKPSNKQLDTICKCVNHFLQMILVTSIEKTGFNVSCVSMSMILFDIMKYLDSIIFPEYLSDLSTKLIDMIVDKLSSMCLKTSDTFQKVLSSILSKWGAYINGDRTSTNEFIKIERVYQPNMIDELPKINNNDNNNNVNDNDKNTNGKVNGYLSNGSNIKNSLIDFNHFPAGLSPSGALLNYDAFKVDLDIESSFKNLTNNSTGTISMANTQSKKANNMWKSIGGGVLPLQPNSDQLLNNSIDLFGGINSNVKPLLKNSNMPNPKRQQSDPNFSSHQTNNNLSSTNQSASSFSSQSTPSQQPLTLGFTSHYLLNNPSMPHNNISSGVGLMEHGLTQTNNQKSKLPSLSLNNNNNTVNSNGVTNNSLVNGQQDLVSGSSSLFYGSSSNGTGNHSISSRSDTPSAMTNGPGPGGVTGIGLTPFFQFLETPGCSSDFARGDGDGSDLGNGNCNSNGNPNEFGF